MISERFGQPGHRASIQYSKGLKVKSQQVMTKSSKAGHEISGNQHMGEKKLRELPPVTSTTLVAARQNGSACIKNLDLKNRC